MDALAVAAQAELALRKTVVVTMWSHSQTVGHKYRPYILEHQPRTQRVGRAWDLSPHQSFAAIGDPTNA